MASVRRLCEAMRTARKICFLELRGGSVMVVRGDTLRTVATVFSGDPANSALRKLIDLPVGCP
jgi:hypothetical protein